MNLLFNYGYNWFLKISPKSPLELEQVGYVQHLDTIKHNKDIFIFTLSSPCLWTSFHPLTPLLVASVK